MTSKLPRRGLFGLGVGAASAAVLPGPVKAEKSLPKMQKMKFAADPEYTTYSGYEILHIQGHKF
jgi:hypothetical protein